MKNSIFSLFFALPFLLMGRAKAEAIDHSKYLNALNEYTANCQDSNAQACQALGKTYGDDKINNIADFISLTKNQCETKSDAENCFAAAQLYYNGQNKQKNNQQAFDY